MKKTINSNDFRLFIYKENNEKEDGISLDIKSSDLELSASKFQETIKLFIDTVRRSNKKELLDIVIMVEITSLKNKEDSEEYVELHYREEHDSGKSTKQLALEFSNKVFERVRNFYVI